MNGMSAEQIYKSLPVYMAKSWTINFSHHEAGIEVIQNALAAARADEREIVSDFVGRWVECRVCKKRHHIRDSHKCFYCKDFYCAEDAERHFNGHRDGERMEARGHLERVRVKAWNEAMEKGGAVLQQADYDAAMDCCCYSRAADIIRELKQ